jgi:K+-sensing histidine kinase KdpD
MCLKNIVENALVHGKHPIKVELTIKKDLLFCKIYDGGEHSYSTLEELMKSKHSNASQSLGLGMGLSIVKKIIKEMGGDLMYQKSPKCLILQLPQGKK